MQQDATQEHLNSIHSKLGGYADLLLHHPDKLVQPNPREREHDDVRLHPEARVDAEQERIVEGQVSEGVEHDEVEDEEGHEEEGEEA